MGRMPKGMGSASPVSTAITPGSAAARRVSTCLIFACAWRERCSLQWSMRGSTRSSAKSVWPVTLAPASTFSRGVPTTANFRSPSATRALHPPGGELHRLVDLQIAGAAAEVARERVLDLVARRARIRGEQRLRGEEKSRRAVAALCRAELGEGLLQRVQHAAFRHAFHRLDRALGILRGEREAGEHLSLIHEHRAHAALAELTTMLGAG